MIHWDNEAQIAAREAARQDCVYMHRHYGAETFTRSDFQKMSEDERQELFKYNPDLYFRLNNF